MYSIFLNIVVSIKPFTSFLIRPLGVRRYRSVLGLLLYVEGQPQSRIQISGHLYSLLKFHQNNKEMKNRKVRVM